MKSVVDVILVFDSCKTEMHPQKYAEGHRSYGCGAVWQSFTLSVFFCAILWMCFVISFARRTNGHAEVIEHDGEQASTSHAVERCQEPPSTTYRALNRLTLGGSRHLRRNDSRPRCAFVFAAQRQLHSPRSGRQNLAVGETHGTGSDAPLSRAAAT